MSKMAKPSTRLSVWDYFFRALALLSLLLFVALAWDLLAHPDAPQFSTPPSPLWFHALFGFVILPLWWLVSVLILWHAPGNLVGRFLLLMMIGALGWQFTLGIGTPEFGSVAFELFLFYWGAIGFPSLVYLLMVFPDGKLFPLPWRLWVLLFATAKVLGTVLDILSYQPDTQRFGPALGFNPFFVSALAPYQNAISATIGAIGIFILIGVIMGIASLVLRYRGSSTQVQQQIKWLLWWAVVFVLVMPLYYLISLGIPVGNAQITTLIPLLMYLNLGGLLIVAIGIAILRYHLFNIDLILNRTLVYGGLSLGVVVGYVLIVGVLSAQFQAGNNLIISLLATGIIAMLFQPVRERLQRSVNRLIYGERDDPYVVLSQLGQRLETALAPNAVLPTICEWVAKALKVSYVAIELGAEDGGRKTEATFPASVVRRPSSVVSFPLIYHHETLGQLIVAPRIGEERFSPVDMRLLKDLARQAGIAAHSVRLTADLQKSRERLVAAREEERRRIRRDLHDGLGPALAAQQLKVGSARTFLPNNPKDADLLLAQLEQDIDAAVGDIRRLVYELRPPALDELGLVGAIRNQAAQYELSGVQIDINAPHSLPPLPAAVEVAAYRIGQEALTNVVRHAHAQQCHLSIEVDGDLRLEIRDDGIGLPADAQASVGLHSMSERAEELGGTCVIESNGGNGTKVSARLPISS